MSQCGLQRPRQGGSQPGARGITLRSGRLGKLPLSIDSYAAELDPRAGATLNGALACSVVGGPAAVRRGIEEFAAYTGADELMAMAQLHDHTARRRSFETLAGVHEARAVVLVA